MNTYSTLLAVALYFSASVCVAQWSYDPAVSTPVRTGPDGHYWPTVVPSDSGSVFVFWGEMDSVNTGPPEYIYGYMQVWKFQKILADGSMLFPPEGRTHIYCVFPEVTEPKTVPWKNGGIIVAWADYTTQMVQALDRNGNVIWTWQTGVQFGGGPELVSDGHSGCFLAPKEFGINWGDGGMMSVFHIDSSGNATWPQKTVVDSAMINYAAGDGMGNVFLVNITPQLQLALKKVDISGTSHWGAPGENNLHVYLHNNSIRVVGDGYGGAFTTWIASDNNAVLAHISSDGVWGTGLNGAVIGTSSAVNTVRRINTIENGPGKIIYAWENAGDSLVVQCYDTMAIAQWNGGAPVFIDTGAVVREIVRNTPQTVVIFYTQFNGSDIDIYAKQISNNGSVMWNGNKKSIVTASGDQEPWSYGSTATSLGTDSVFLAWVDKRSGTYEIYCTAIDGDGNNLPVELLSFSASLVESSVLLNWRTASETNNAGFRVQRSLEGSAWESIGYVHGAGTSDQPGEYTFLDPIDQLSTDGAYYRLRQEDYDGTHEYSPLQYVAFHHQPTSVALHGVYPNPASGQIQIGFTLDGDYPVTLGIYSILGAKVREVPAGRMPAGSHLIPANVSGLPEGMYILRMVTPAGVQSVKMRVGGR